MNTPKKDLFQLDYLENRMLLSSTAGSTEDSEDKTAKKKHSSIFSKISSKIKNTLSSDSNTKTNQTAINSTLEAVSADLNDLPAESLSTDNLKTVFTEYLNLLDPDSKSTLSIDGLLSKLTNSESANIAEKVLGLLDEFKSLGTTEGQSNILDLVNKLNDASLLDGLVLVVSKGASLSDLVNADADPLVTLLKGLESNSTGLLDFVTGLTSNADELNKLISFIQKGAQAMQDDSVNLATDVTSVLTRNEGILKAFKTLLSDPNVLKDSSLQALVEHFIAVIKQAEAVVDQVSGVTSSQDGELMQDAEALGEQIQNYLSLLRSGKISAEDIQDNGGVDNAEASYNATITNTTLASENLNGTLGLNETLGEETSVVKKKTKNPFKRVLHHIQKYDLPAAEKKLGKVKDGIIEIEHAIANKVKKIVQSAEKKIEKLKNHLKEFSSSQDKLSFIENDAKIVAKKVHDKAKKVFDAVNPTKENRSLWEYKIAGAIHSMANMTVKFADFVDAHTDYNSKLVNSSQIVTYAISKILYMAGGVTGVAATAYPPIAVASLALAVLSKGIELAADEIPLVFRLVDHLGHANAKLVGYIGDRVHNAADLLELRAEHLHDLAMKNKNETDVGFFEGLSSAMKNDTEIQYLFNELGDSFDDVVDEVGDFGHALHVAAANVTLDFSQSIENINSSDVHDFIETASQDVLDVAGAFADAMPIVEEGLHVAGYTQADSTLASLTQAAEKIESKVQDVKPDVEQLATNVLAAAKPIAKEIADVFNSKGIAALPSVLNDSMSLVNNTLSAMSSIFSVAGLSNEAEALKNAETLVNDRFASIASAVNTTGYNNIANVFIQAKQDFSGLIGDISNALHGNGNVTALIEDAKGVMTTRLSTLNPVLSSMGLGGVADGISKVETAVQPLVESVASTIADVFSSKGISALPSVLNDSMSLVNNTLSAMSSIFSVAGLSNEAEALKNAETLVNSRLASIASAVNTTGYNNIASVFIQAKQDFSGLIGDISDALNGNGNVTALIEDAKGVMTTRLSTLNPILSSMGLGNVADGISKVESTLQPVVESVASTIGSDAFQNIVSLVSQKNTSISEAISGLKALSDLGAISKDSPLIGQIQTVVNTHLGELNSLFDKLGTDQQKAMVQDAQSVVDNLFKALPVALSSAGLVNPSAIVTTAQNLLDSKFESWMQSIDTMQSNSTGVASAASNTTTIVPVEGIASVEDAVAGNSTSNATVIAA